MGKNNQEKKLTKKFLKGPSEDIPVSVPGPSKPPKRLNSEDLWKKRIIEEYKKIMYKRSVLMGHSDDEDINLLWNLNLETVKREAEQRGNSGNSQQAEKPIEKAFVFNPPPIDPSKKTSPPKRHKKGRKKKNPTIVKISPVTPIPNVDNWIFINKNVSVEDEKELYNMPYLGEEVIDKEEDFIDDIICTYDGRHEDHDEDLMTDVILIELINALNGLGERDEISKKFTDAERAIFENIKKENVDEDDQGNSAGHNGSCKSQSAKPGFYFVRQIPEIQTISKFPSNEIIKLVAQTFSRFKNEALLRKKIIEICSRQSSFVIPSEFVPNPNIDRPIPESLPREKTLSAFHKHFCRRCFIYNCTLHPLKEDRPEPKPQTQVKKEENLKKAGLCGSDCYQREDSNNGEIGKSFKTSLRFIVKGLETLHINTWTKAEESFFQALRKVFLTNYCAISHIMLTKTCKEVFIQDDQVETRAEVQNVKSSQCQSALVKKMQTLKRQWSTYCIKNNIKNNTTRRGHHVPCNHRGSECDKNCQCIQARVPCEKFCLCNSQCENRFPGCECKGQCKTKRCTCFIDDRECDPDLCTDCCDGMEKQPHPAKIRCKNINILLGIHKHLLFAPSEISGWGIYLKDAIQKHDFIAEYCGEVISQEEAERRGKIYDKKKISFLFNLNNEYVVDATRKGNKARFINHSVNPNCEAKVRLVNGDHRIGIYSNKAIETGEELFFDYGYESNQKLMFVAIEKPNVSEQNSVKILPNQL